MFARTVFACLCVFLCVSALAASPGAAKDPPRNGPPVVAYAVHSDSNRDGLAGTSETLTLVMSVGVVVTTPALGASHFFLPVEGDELGATGFVVETTAHNSRHVVLRTGIGSHLTVPGKFIESVFSPNSPSGIDLAASLPPGHIVGLTTGIPAIDGGAPAVDDHAVDIVFSCLWESYDIGPAGGTAGVAVDSVNAFYTKHSLQIPPGSLDADYTFTFGPPADSHGVLNAVRIDAQSFRSDPKEPGKLGPRLPSVAFSIPATLILEYHESDVDVETGESEADLLIHEWVDDAVEGWHWAPVPGEQIVDPGERTVSVFIEAIGSGGTRGGGQGVYAVLPGQTVKPKTIYLRSQSGSTAVLLPASGGDYMLHRIEFPGYAETTSTDTMAIQVAISQATLLRRVSATSASFPATSGALFVITATSPVRSPLQFNSSVNLCVQFMTDTSKGYDDLVDLQGQAAQSYEMRIVRDAADGASVDFQHVELGPQTVDTLVGTVRATGVMNLTGASGQGVWGVVALPVAPARSRTWHLYE